MITIADWEADAENWTAIERLSHAHFLWKFKKPPYAEWVKSVEEAVYLQSQEMAGTKNYIADHQEDGLTAQVLQGLKMLALDASMRMVNGNCDVTVRYREYLWIGEAKIARGVSVVWDGFLQLTTRYATGIPGQTAGGMLIYCKDVQTNEFMGQWRAALNVDLSDAQFEECNAIPLGFSTSHPSQATGALLRVTHIPFPLLHAPKDGVLKLSKDAQDASRREKARIRKDDS